MLRSHAVSEVSEADGGERRARIVRLEADGTI